jgi:Asp-tRNA(Asn)/Glu-tRNA(Gln) amidotransferase A subunit family amidase
LRVAVSPDLGFARVANSVREDFATKMARLAPNFGSCLPLDLNMESAERVCWILRCLYLLSTHQERSQQYPDALEEKLLGNLKAARALSASDIAWAHAEQARLCQQFSAIFDTFDVLITPATSVSPFPAELAYPASIDGVPLAHYAEWLGITYGVTLVGHPALAMPCGTDRRGLPFGIQLIGRRHGDLDLLSVGLGLEICTGDDAEVGRTRWTFG